MLRCFDDGDITHVENRVDPVADAETVETELMLSDLDSLERRLPAVEKKAKQGDKDSKVQADVMQAALAMLREGKPARLVKVTDEQRPVFEQLQLLTSKPVVYVANVDEGAAATGNHYTKRVEERAKSEGAAFVVISAKIESELAQLNAEERADFLSTLGLEEPGLNKLIRAGYSLLRLITFFTIGPKEARAWTVHAGARAPQAAGVIHTDFEKGFIRAETIAYEDYVACQGEAGAKDAGKLRLEGKEYVVRDGDVMHFRFNT